MDNKEQNILVEEILKSLDKNFDAAHRAQILQQLKESNPTNDALLGAKLLLEENNWDYKVVQQAFAKTESRIDSLASKPAKSKRNLLKYAAVLAPFLMVFGYYFSNANKSIDGFYTSADGLPNTMSAENASSWEDVMIPYRAAEYEKALAISKTILIQKPANDTAVYYQAVVAYELHQYNLSKRNFKLVISQKNSNFYNESAFRLGFTLAKLNETQAANEQFKKVAKDTNNPYFEDAKTILREVY